MLSVPTLRRREVGRLEVDVGVVERGLDDGARSRHEVPPDGGGRVEVLDLGEGELRRRRRHPTVLEVVIDR